MSAAEFWSDEIGRRRGDPTARRRPAHARALGSPAADLTGPVGSTAALEDDRWPLGPGTTSWDAWGPPPAMHPDHPSAPVPRVRVQVDYNDPVEFTGPLPRLNGNGRHSTGSSPARMPQAGRQQGPRGGGAAQAHARQDFAPPWAQAPSQGYVAQGYTAQGFTAQGYAWQAYGGAQAYAEPAEYEDPRGYAGPQAYAEPATYAPAETYPQEQGYAGPDPSAYARPQRQHRPHQAPSAPRGYQAARGRLHAVPSGPDLDYQSEPDSGPQSWPNGPAGGRTASRDQQDYTAVREAAEREAKAIREQAVQEAAALTREATQQAAKIREAAEKEAAQMRAALAAMSGEMGRVAAYVSENLTVPAIPAARPAEAPVTRPTRPASLPAAPATRPELPAQRPERPARPAQAPAAPAKEPGKRTRQQNAMRVSKLAVAAGLLGVAAAAGTEFALHGPSFFVFRQSGTGETPGNNTDQNFLARQQAEEHPKPTQPKVVKPATKPAAPAPKPSH